MTHPVYLREKAITLRRDRRLSIDEIATRLALSRSTVYHWVRDIPLGRERRHSSRAQRLGNRRMRSKYRLLREQAYAEGRALYPSLAAHPTFRDFVTLYVAEGYKRSRNTVSIANSDPAVIAVADYWLRRVTDRRRIYSVQYHADQDLAEICRFWSSLVAVQPSDIRLQRKSNSGQLGGRSWRSVHGVLTITVNDTYLRARLQAWIDLLAEEWTTIAASGV